MLIVYATTEGQTRKIAERIAEQLRGEGHEVECHFAPESREQALTGMDAVIVGASVHYGRFPKYMTAYAKTFADQLNRIPSAFFSVSGSAATPKHLPEAEKITRRYLERSGWRPDLSATFAGCYAYTKYGPLKRQMMKLFARVSGHSTDTSRDQELTDWAQVELFTRQFLARLPVETPPCRQVG